MKNAYVYTAKGIAQKARDQCAYRHPPSPGAALGDEKSGMDSCRKRSFARCTKSCSRSKPIKLLSRDRATNAVVPEPMNGSSTTSPGLENVSIKTPGRVLGN